MPGTYGYLCSTNWVLLSTPGGHLWWQKEMWREAKPQRALPSCLGKITILPTIEGQGLTFHSVGINKTKAGKL